MNINIKSLFSYLYTSFWRIIAPPFCVHCKSFLSADTIFCSVCITAIKPIVSTTLPITKIKSMKVFAISDYKEPLRSLILAKGHGDSLASYQLGRLIWQLTYVQQMPCDLLVPIPLHWTRYAWRGFNQADNIAQELSIASDKPVVSLLSRIKRTLPQSQLSQEARQYNVKDIFVLAIHDKHAYEGKHIVLIDDLMTTGATLRAAAKEVMKLKPASVTAVVACRVV